MKRIVGQKKKIINYSYKTKDHCLIIDSYKQKKNIYEIVPHTKCQHQIRRTFIPNRIICQQMRHKQKKLYNPVNQMQRLFINSKEEKNFMVVTHKFRDFTILLIKIVSPQNKIKVHITKRIQI